MPKFLPFITLLLLVAILFVVSLCTGEASIKHELIFTEIRLPRAILAVIVGASFGLSGAALQGFLKNPLAEPAIIGVSASAAFGAVIAFYTGLSAVFMLALPLGGVAGALLSVVVLAILSGKDSSILTFILAGVVLNSFAGALTALVLNMSPNPFASMEIIFWLMGSLADRSFEHVWLAMFLMIPGWLLLLSVGRCLDALTLGEDTAQSLGFNLKRTQISIITGTALSVGAAVSVTGVIGFIGLVVPHLLRPFAKGQPSRLLWLSMLGGAVMLLVSDIIVRILPFATELKIGVVTSLV
ncbi:MAG: iron ABC transporter permease, partial [Alphaproteobacteria bacterium]|nr:iron ABC transporter permease [Alphaproteobacteria bacterium]